MRDRASWLAGAGAALLLGGLALRAVDYEAIGRVCIISGGAAWAYLIHAYVVARSIERAARRAVSG